MQKKSKGKVKPKNSSWAKYLKNEKNGVSNASEMCQLKWNWNEEFAWPLPAYMHASLSPKFKVQPPITTFLFQEKLHELSSGKLNNLEAAALVTKSESSIKFDSIVVPPAPPKRVDSTRMNNFYSPSPLDSDSQLQASSPNLSHKIRTNRCVETDI